ncbi:hypothetical protein GDO86_006957 [Hymenochirus boettgeri]|uniref:Folate receptor-like domain-containing protein n=1 Tax=Hymenochirus boettgeri TaxID=247094 RepID=A0A8T2JFP7_9PIPI|nr:hypothetical protein GDO86_006957 [Hymenochirus boettgeri]
MARGGTRDRVSSLTSFRHVPLKNGREICLHQSSFLLHLPVILLHSGSLDVATRRPNQVPRAEPDLQDCQHYSDNACCNQDYINAHPITSFPWGLCGPLSARCQELVSQVQCMYLCSPHFSAHRRKRLDTGINDIPLGSEFCDQWFEACRNDLVCKLTNESTPTCADGCATYEVMFKSGGKDLCDNIWGELLEAVPENGEQTKKPHKYFGIIRLRRSLENEIPDVEGSGSGMGV